MSQVKDKPAAPDGASQPSVKGYDFSKSSIKNITQRRFNFGPAGGQPVNVDQTLAHLFDTLSVECSGILVHPQWKHFRHIRMLKNDQIRLSNGIWRSWHLQFQKRRKPLYCSFDIEAELDHHTRQEAVVLEGKYWKRRPDAVASEYRKWRYYREKKQVKNVDPVIREKAEDVFVGLMSMVKQRQPQEMQVDSPSRPSLFQNTEERFPMESPGDPMDAYTVYDMMVQQPNLDMLNPMMDDFLNRISEPMDIIMGGKGPSMMGGALAFGGNSRNEFSPAVLPTFTSPSSQTPSQQQQSLSQQQQQQQSVQAVPMQLSLDNPAPGPAAPKDLQDPFSAAFNLLTAYQDVAMAEQPRYSPSSFLSGGGGGGGMGQDQQKGGPLLNLQQAGNFAMKAENSGGGGSEEGFYQSSTGSYQGGGGGGQMYRNAAPQQQQQQQKDGMLDSVLSQFYQEVEAGSIISQQQQQQQQQQQEAISPSSHISPGHHTPHSHGGIGGGGTFKFPSTSSSPSPLPMGHMPTPPPTAIEQQQQNRHYSLGGGGGGGGGVATPFLRVSSAGNLPARAEHGPSATPSPSSSSSERPPLERGKSEPIRHLQDKVRNLNAQQLRQMEELDKQKTLAEVQYSELLMQMQPPQPQSRGGGASAAAAGKLGATPGGPSEEQKHVLQSVLSDPSLVKILRSLLLASQPPDSASSSSSQPHPHHRGVGGSVASPPLIAPASHLHPRRASSGGPTPTLSSQVVVGGQAYPQQVLSPPDILSPTQSAGLSDLQGQFMSPNSVASPCSPSPSTTIPTAGSSDVVSPTQTMLKKFKNSRNLTSSEKEVYKEIRRQSHISAEQKRRGSIKQGFDYLQMLVINTATYPSGKVSKAMILEKTLEHIHRCHVEKENREKQMETLKARIEELNAAIALCQEKLPASGAPVTRQRFEENRQRFRTYVQKRSLQNYKFGVFSIIIQQLFESYNSMVSTGTVDELCRTVLAWFEQNCTLPSLRPIVMNSLKELIQRTSILSDPSQVPRQLTQYAQQIAQEQQQDSQTRRQQDQPQQNSMYS